MNEFKKRQCLALKVARLSDLLVQIKQTMKECLLKMHYGANLGREYDGLLNLKRSVKVDLNAAKASLALMDRNIVPGQRIANADALLQELRNDRANTGTEAAAYRAGWTIKHYDATGPT